MDDDQFSIPIQTSGDNLIWIDLLLSSIGFTSVNNAHLKPSYTDTNLQYTVWLVYIPFHVEQSHQGTVSEWF